MKESDLNNHHENYLNRIAKSNLKIVSKIYEEVD